MRGGGGFYFSPKSYVDVPARPRKSDFPYTNFLPNFPLISIPFSKEKHPILNKLGAFYNNLPKIHTIYTIWAHSSLIKPPIAIPNFVKKRPKRQAHIRISCQCENPPGEMQQTKISFRNLCCSSLKEHSLLKGILQDLLTRSDLIFLKKKSNFVTIVIHKCMDKTQLKGV